MNNIQPADVFDSGYDLLEEPASIFLFDPLVLNNIVKKLSTRGILHNQVQFPLSFDYLIQLHYIWMPDYL